MNTNTNAALLLGRVLASIIFVLGGYNKLMAAAATQAGFAHIGVPMPHVAYPVSVAIELGGGKPFFDYSVPQAVIKLKQGFGRLIRTATDTGTVVLFDPRVLTKAYGAQFLAALPRCKRVVDGAAA